MLTDAVGNELRVGDTVAYITKGNGPGGMATLSPGVVISLNTTKPTVQPLEYIRRSWTHIDMMGLQVFHLIDGDESFAVPCATAHVHHKRMVVCPSIKESEMYKNFEKWGFIDA